MILPMDSSGKCEWVDGKAGCCLFFRLSGATSQECRKGNPRPIPVKQPASRGRTVGSQRIADPDPASGLAEARSGVLPVRSSSKLCFAIGTLLQNFRATAHRGPNHVRALTFPGEAAAARAIRPRRAQRLVLLLTMALRCLGRRARRAVSPPAPSRSPGAHHGIPSLHDASSSSASRPTRSRRGLIIPDTAKEKPGGLCVRGSGPPLEDGTVRPVAVKAGDRILFGKYTATRSRSTARARHRREMDVLAVIER